MKRRELLTRVVMVTAAAMIPVPKWIGEAAGGVYVPPPRDFASVVDVAPWAMVDSGLHANPITGMTEICGALACVVWAEPNAIWAHFTFIGGQVPITEDEVRREPVELLKQRKLKTLMASMLNRADESHYPGWFHVDGRNWQRVGYVDWVKPSILCGNVVYHVDSQGGQFNYERPEVFQSDLIVTHNDALLSGDAG